MKHPFSILVFLSLTSALSIANVVSKPVVVKLGAKAFHEGDVVSISEVKSTSDKMEVGDTVTVKGKYRLQSQQAAKLMLSITRTKTAKGVEIDKSQALNAKTGWHEFELSTIIKHQGVMHLTFYDKNGKAFGGVYFGKPDQIDNAKNISVAHYTK